MSFSFYKGKTADQILIGSSPTSTLIKEMEKECGKTTVVLKGVCFYEGDILVFATKAVPPPALKMQITKVLKERKCQGISKIDLRQLGPGESDEAADEGTEAEGEEGSTDAGGTLQAALEGWQAARADAIAQLQALDAAIKGFQHPQSAAAIVMVKAIQANLTAKPDSLQSVTELEQYIGTDQIVTDVEGRNGFGVSVVLRKPLLAALAKLKPHFSE